jgi:Saxitoxin biosynthesis operon protein SxtJ
MAGPHSGPECGDTWPLVDGVCQSVVNGTYVVSSKIDGLKDIMGTNRRFGLVLVGACMILYAIGLWSGSGHVSWLIAAGFFLLITCLMPRILQPVKNLWMKLGGPLHAVISPVLLFLFYFLGVMPIGMIMQMFGNDPLRLKPNSNTYWIERKPPGPAPETMTELF